MTRPVLAISGGMAPQRVRLLAARRRRAASARACSALGCGLGFGTTGGPRAARARRPDPPANPNEGRKVVVGCGVARPWIAAGPARLGFGPVVGGPIGELPRAPIGRRQVSFDRTPAAPRREGRWPGDAPTPG